MTDTNKLKELAALATPGPWTTDAAQSVIADNDQLNSGWVICECFGSDEKANREFIKAANPAAVLELIVEVERLRGDLPRLVSYAEDMSTCTLTMDDGNGYFYNRVTDKELAEIDQLTQEVAWLRKRLEMSDKHPHDGIACRDETIKGMDEKCGRIEAENEALRGEVATYEDGMRSLASNLGAGGYNAETLTAAQLVDKVQWGVDNLAETQARLLDEVRAENTELRKTAERYRELRKITPNRFKKLQEAATTDGGDVFYFHADRFDAALDAALEGGGK